MTRKSVYVNLNPKTDADLIDIMERSTLSDPMFLKTLARLAIKNNKEIIENMGILQNGVTLKDTKRQDNSVKESKKKSDSVQNKSNKHDSTLKDIKKGKGNKGGLNIGVK